MMNDVEFARKLQEEYDREAAERLDQGEDAPNQSSLEKSKGNESNGHSTNIFSNLSPVDPSFEFTDPNPDIRILFLQFNEEYFWGKLSGIEVKWSPRMTLCAGICVYEGHGGLCSVRLSLPLLKLRPRKDLVETLLHEMIHAYLFITKNDRDRDGHGPNFQNHMNRINKSTGAKISIYHTFHGEVQLYQQHWWRCNGPCQHRKPYFGYVKRAMNRAPSSNDFWWSEHKATCGGTYTKVKEPENYGKTKAELKKDKEKKKYGKDIQSFMDKGKISSPSKTSKGVHGLFEITGKSTKTLSKAGSVISKGNEKDNLSTKGNTSSKHIVSGGVLIPKASLNQSPLFTSVGLSNSISSHSLPSSSKNSKTHPVSTQGVPKQTKINDVFHNTSRTERDVTQNGKSGSSLQSTHRDKAKQHTILSPYRNKKNLHLPTDFRSVCVGGKGGLSSKGSSNRKNSNKGKRKKKKYIFDELDDDEDLWGDMSSQSDSGDSYVERIGEQSGNKLSSMSPLNKKLKDICKIPLTDNSVVKRNILSEIIPELDERESPSFEHQRKSIDSHFPGKGYQLGGIGQYLKSSAKGKSQNLMSIDLKSNLIKQEKSESLISQERRSGSDHKRSFDGAFTSQVIDISDSDEEEAVPSNRHSFKKIKKENILEGAEEENGAVAMATDENEMATALPSNVVVSGNSEKYVSCPACNTKVFHDAINSHLDMCLQMS